MGHPCATIGAIWQRARVLARTLMLAVTDPYRPERHYMRGPGPKCRAREFVAGPVTDHFPAPPSGQQTSGNERLSLQPGLRRSVAFNP
jgi:hypothetical protein